MNADNWRVDVIGGEFVRIVLWDQHWTTNFTPSEESLSEIIDALTQAKLVVARGEHWRGTAQS